MNNKTFRDNISQQCGFNKAKSMDEYDPLLAAYNNGNGNQTDNKAKHYLRHKDGDPLNNHLDNLKPYALQVCNAGAMPDRLPTSFSDWLASNNDSIDIGGNWTPDRIQANHDQYKQLPF